VILPASRIGCVWFPFWDGRGLCRVFACIYSLLLTTSSTRWPRLVPYSLSDFASLSTVQVDHAVNSRSAPNRRDQDPPGVLGRLPNGRSALPEPGRRYMMILMACPVAQRPLILEHPKWTQHMQKLAEASSAAGRAIQTGCVPKRKFVAHVWSPYGQNRPRTACRRTDIWASAGADLDRHQSAFSGVLLSCSERAHIT
jgi:hypothetical protein